MCLLAAREPYLFGRIGRGTHSTGTTTYHVMCECVCVARAPISDGWVRRDILPFVRWPATTPRHPTCVSDNGGPRVIAPLCQLDLACALQPCNAMSGRSSLSVGPVALVRSARRAYCPMFDHTSCAHFALKLRSLRA